ncbi:hypothetical protein GRAQ_03339 [Rahnella aquatilis CIP 78.65 = ATCC 33071]|nr:hypothetical protein GRAQ_03339 [Rahnella aquatilis CIP 78.65 = ATCC 33071]
MIKGSGIAPEGLKYHVDHTFDQTQSVPLLPENHPISVLIFT